VFRIRIELNTDPDPAFLVNTDPDPAPNLDSDPRFFMIKMKEIFFEKFKYYFQSQNVMKTLIEDSQAQVKTIRPSAKWSIFFLP